MVPRHTTADRLKPKLKSQETMRGSGKRGSCQHIISAVGNMRLAAANWRPMPKAPEFMANSFGRIWIHGYVAMLTLSGCEQGTHALVEVRSNRDVLFSIPEEDAPHYCINSVEIRRYSGGPESTNYEVNWRIRLKSGQSGPCDLSINYPKVPSTFVTEVASERLSAGNYVVVIDGGIGTATGEFTIPPGSESDSTNRH